MVNSNLFLEGTQSLHTKKNYTGKIQWNLNFHPFVSYESVLFPKSGTLGNPEARLELWSHFFSSGPQPLATLCAETRFIWNSASGLNCGLGRALPEPAYADFSVVSWSVDIFYSCSLCWASILFSDFCVHETLSSLSNFVEIKQRVQNS